MVLVMLKLAVVTVLEPKLLLYVELVFLGIAMVFLCCLVVWSDDIVLYFQCDNNLNKITF